MYPIPPTPRHFDSWRSAHKAILVVSPQVTGQQLITYGNHGTERGDPDSNSKMPFYLVAEYAAKEALNEASIEAQALSREDIDQLLLIVQQAPANVENGYAELEAKLLQLHHVTT